MKTLVLAEKPSVAKSLAQVLGASPVSRHAYENQQYVITWALGHLMTLKMPEDYRHEWQEWTFDTLPLLPKKMETKPLPKTRGQLKAIQQLTRRSDIGTAVIATDAGREGELVARWILAYCQFKRPVKRLWISSQTNKAVRDGFKQLRPAQEFDDLYAAATARATADWLVGLNVTRALTVKYQDNLAAGRVQTPTLGLIAQQEAKINQFKPQTYYELQLKTKAGTAKLATQKQMNLDQVTKIQAGLKGRSFQVTRCDTKKRRQKAPLPYDLTELQKDANLRYQFSAKKTLNLLQTLYEQYKVVSYPRTDSKYLSTDLKATMPERLAALGGYSVTARQLLAHQQTVQQKQVFNDQKVTDHYGLIPTEEMPPVARFSNDEQKIYQMIVDRFLGLFAADYQEEQRRYQLTAGQYQFHLTTAQVLVAGFKGDQVQSVMAPQWQVNTTVTGQLNYKKCLTKAPAPLSEATLLVQMDKFGLGTPATRAEIIEKLINSGLMLRQGQHLATTPKGQQLLKLVNPSLTTPALTAKWEQQLEAIAHGQLAAPQFIQQIKQETQGLVREIKQSQADYHDFNLTGKRCPDCNEPLREKATRQGVLLVCSNPNCHYKRWRDPKVTNHRCPQCHKKMIILTGTKGDYFKCTHCNLTQPVEQVKQQRKPNRHETQKLLKKINQDEEPQESALAQALKAAMQQK